MMVYPTHVNTMFARALFEVQRRVAYFCCQSFFDWLL